MDIIQLLCVLLCNDLVMFVVYSFVLLQSIYASSC